MQTLLVTLLPIMNNSFLSYFLSLEVQLVNYHFAQHVYYRRSNPTTTTTKNPSQEMILKANDLCPSLTLSLDQYKSSIRGRTLNSRGKTPDHLKFCGGTISVDHVTDYVFHNH